MGESLPNLIGVIQKGLLTVGNVVFLMSNKANRSVLPHVQSMQKRPHDACTLSYEGMIM